jgi:hypothetical protein
MEPGLSEAKSGLQPQAIPVHSTVTASMPMLTKPLAWAAQGATSVKQATDRSVQVLADGLAWAAGIIQAAWVWTGDQIVRMTQAPWESWPLWKQILLVIVAGAVIYFLFIAARQLWWATLNVVSAVAGFIGTLIVTLPTILLAGAIALGGLWIINNFRDLSSLHSITTFPGSDAGTGEGTGGPTTRPGPAETNGGR